MPEMKTVSEEGRVPLNNKCTTRGCDGLVDFDDNSSVFDGAQGRCCLCDRPHIAVAYTDNTMGVIHDIETSRRDGRERRKAFLALKKNPNL